MRKKIVLRRLLGAPLGIVISYVVTLVISLMIGKRTFHPVTPGLIETAGSELNAVLLQADTAVYQI